MNLLAAIGSVKLSLYLKNRVSEEYFDRYSFVLIREADGELLERMTRQSEACRTGGRTRIAAMCRGNPAAETCLELACLEYLVPGVNEVFDIITCYHTKGVTMEIAAKTAYARADISGNAAEILEAYRLIKRILKEELTAESRPYGAGSELYISFHADLFLASYMEGAVRCASLNTDPFRYNFSGGELPPLYLLEEEKVRFAAKAAGTAGRGNVPVLRILGQKHSGRKFLASQIAEQNGWNLVFARYDEIVLENSGWDGGRLKELVRRAAVLGAAICLCDVPGTEEDKRCSELCRLLLRMAAGSVTALFLTGEGGKAPETGSEYPVFTCTIPIPQEEESLFLWNAFSRKYLGREETAFYEAALKIRLPAGQIEQIVREISEDGAKTLCSREVTARCYSAIGGCDGRVKKKEYPYTFGDLKLPPEQTGLLKSICVQVEYRFRVYEEWGLKRLYPYGNCVSALFSGPPGTGKTMAAYVIANELRMELLRVDLSRVVDKYIGETEKNLEEAFRAAEQSSRILFFDEADILFGKRSSIQDSKDRYANNEVAYILQRIEEFEGIVLLATNLMSNIDPAFIRRMRYIVEFPMPDERARRAIWESLFEGKLPHEELDFGFLAKNFEFSGAVIKNIVLNSAFQAAAESGGVAMRHIVQNIANEYRKSGQLVVKDNFLIYGEYL